MRVGAYGIDPTALWQQKLAAVQRRMPAVSAAPAQAAERVGPTLGAEGVRPGAAAQQATGDTFADVLTKAVDSDRAARAAVDTYVRGDKPLHETMLAVTKADISLRLMVNVRNKLLNAYQEVMRMS
jgi:flagellar hook-basal body complex protein FliE